MREKLLVLCLGIMNDSSGIVQVMKYAVSFIALGYAICAKRVNLSEISTVKGWAHTSVRQQNAAHRNVRRGETLAKFDNRKCQQYTGLSVDRMDQSSDWGQSVRGPPAMVTFSGTLQDQQAQTKVTRLTIDSTVVTTRTICCVMAQAVSRMPLTEEAWVQSQTSPHQICWTAWH
jgi:hypothetical protein